MNVKPFALATAGAVALSGSAMAGLVGTYVDTVGSDGDVTTYRLYLVFSNELDQLLAVSGNAGVAALVFNSNNGDLVQNCVLTNSILCDTKGPLDLGGDSWVNIGEESGDTSFSPNFLDGNGSESVIKGSNFSQSDNGGYFDSNPGTPVLPDENSAILIAQFSLTDDANATYDGTADYVPGAADGFVSEAFHFDIPAPGALALLGLAGLAGTRRRR